MAKANQMKWKRVVYTPCGLISGPLADGFLFGRRAGVAQLVELQPSKLNVASSSLVSRSKLFGWN